MKRPPRFRSRKDRGRSGRPGHGRRTPPPERTGLEAAFLHRIAETRQVLRVQLRSGTMIQGIVESFDRDTIAIRPEDGPTVVYRKTDIRCLEE